MAWLASRSQLLLLGLVAAVKAPRRRVPHAHRVGDDRWLGHRHCGLLVEAGGQVLGVPRRHLRIGHPVLPLDLLVAIRLLHQLRALGSRLPSLHHGAALVLDRRGRLTLGLLDLSKTFLETRVEAAKRPPARTERKQGLLLARLCVVDHAHAPRRRGCLGGGVRR
eukprot:scaffold69269_cov63-Phaeocystis_antarctica.AAC.3